MDNDIYGDMNKCGALFAVRHCGDGWLIGEGLLDIHGGDQIGLVVETGCRYFSELAFPDKVTAGIRVARLGTSSVRYEVALFRNEEEIAALKAFSSTSS